MQTLIFMIISVYCTSRKFLILSTFFLKAHKFDLFQNKFSKTIYYVAPRISTFIKSRKFAVWIFEGRKWFYSILPYSLTSPVFKRNIRFCHMIQNKPWNLYLLYRSLVVIFTFIICLINYFVSGHDLTKSQADAKFLDRIKISKQSPNEGKTAQLDLTFSRDK